MENSPPKPAGWQPRYGRKKKLTWELIHAFAAHVAAGQYESTASQLVGITYESCRLWKNRGREIAEQYPEADLEEIPTEEERLFFGFFVALASAQAESVARSVVDIKKAGAADWRAHAWYLERTRPDLYGSVERHVHQLGKSSDAELISEAARLFGGDFAQAVGSALGTGSGAAETEDQERG